MLYYNTLLHTIQSVQNKKHSPPGNEKFRLEHKTEKDGNVDATNIMPGVTIRDPYVWFHSMCRHEYQSRYVYMFVLLHGNTGTTHQ